MVVDLEIRIGAMMKTQPTRLLQHCADMMLLLGLVLASAGLTLNPCLMRNSQYKISVTSYISKQEKAYRSVCGGIL